MTSVLILVIQIIILIRMIAESLLHIALRARATIARQRATCANVATSHHVLKCHYGFWLLRGLTCAGNFESSTKVCLDGSVFVMIWCFSLNAVFEVVRLVCAWSNEQYQDKWPLYDTQAIIRSCCPRINRFERSALPRFCVYWNFVDSFTNIISHVYYPIFPTSFTQACIHSSGWIIGYRPEHHRMHHSFFFGFGWAWCKRGKFPMRMRWYSLEHALIVE